MPIKKRKTRANDDLRAEYELRSLKGGVQGKYLARATAGTTMVLLEPGVADAFSDGASVNRALRVYLRTRSKVAKPGLTATVRVSRSAVKAAKTSRSARA